MESPLAASFFSTNANKNLALPGDTVTFSFNDDKLNATDILVSVLETVEFLNTSTAKVTDRPIGGFRGKVVNGKMQVESILGAPLPPIPDPVNIRVAASSATGSPGLFAHMPEPEQIFDHTLKLKIEGTVKGKKETFVGASLLRVEYPMAMIVTASSASQDGSLAVVESWAQQWKAHKNLHRHIEKTTLTRVADGASIKPSDYDDLVRAFTVCASKATAGVIALATGHGDGGDTQSIAWCNLAPENFKPPTQLPDGSFSPFLYRLDIDQNVLAFALVSSSTPKESEKVKLNALDRIADVLAGTSVRRILLHTCRAGANDDFMQMFADRVRVPLLAHTEQITYTGAVNSNQILASYEGLSAVSPRDLRHWPLRRLSKLFRPSATPPKRFPVP
jgi:hypothetical protein